MEDELMMHAIIHITRATVAHLTGVIVIVGLFMMDY